MAVVTAAIDDERGQTVLLEGDTASGKTAVYAEAIAHALAKDRGALVLVPEIALAAPLIDRLRHDLYLDVAMLHSAMSDGERADEWRRIRAGEARVVVAEARGQAEIERGKDFVQLKNGPFDLDLVFAPDGIEEFEQAWKRRVDVEGFPVCHPDDIIRSKEAAGRVKDREVLPRLRAFRDYWLERNR